MKQPPVIADLMAQRRVIADLMTAAGFALVETQLVSCWRKTFPGATCSIAAEGVRAFDDPTAPVWAAWIVNNRSFGFQTAGPLSQIQLVCRARTLSAALEAAQDRLPKAQ